jgi:hypothetical protein
MSDEPKKKQKSKKKKVLRHELARLTADVAQEKTCQTCEGSPCRCGQR